MLLLVLLVLLLMKCVQTVFVQGISSPQLEFLLSSLTVRIAQSKGLHKRPSSCLGLSHEQIHERNTLFWTIYILDKTSAIRCGRPSVSIHGFLVKCRGMAYGVG